MTLGAKTAAGLGLCLLTVAFVARPTYRLLRPRYETVELADGALRLEYPAAWKNSGLHAERDLRILYLRPAKAAPFDTFWDREPASFRLVEFPAAAVGDPKEHLLKVAANRRVNAPDAVPDPPAIGTIALADGTRCLTLTLPAEHDEFDLGEKRRGMLASLYRALFVGRPSRTYVLVSGNREKTYEIAYLIPGDRLSAYRYRNVYQVMLRSLRLKQEQGA